ncbi:MAG: hypothetical protein M1820_005825 [Bogoriella megaspora]|nr:MAG: hypothetical protein M1820_005825 [Bogoriella megaspora]
MALQPLPSVLSPSVVLLLPLHLLPLHHRLDEGLKHLRKRRQNGSESNLVYNNSTLLRRGRLKKFERYWRRRKILERPSNQIDLLLNYEVSMTTQLTTTINKWKLPKYIRKEAYQHLIRKEEEARNSTNPSKRKRYTVGNLQVKRAKFERYKDRHPELKPLRSPTPSDIVSETERFSDITEAMSELRLGEDNQSESLADDVSGSFDSDVALMVHPHKDSFQQFENLYTNLHTISQDLGEHSNINQDDKALETEADTSSPGAKGRLRSKSSKRAYGRIVPFSQRRRRPIPQSSETHHPGTYCPSVSKSGWWPEYVLFSTNNSRPLYAADDDNLPSYRAFERRFEEFLSECTTAPITTELFEGLIFKPNTYADEMAYREKVHQHLILAIEAGIPPPEVSERSPILYQTVLLPWVILLKYDVIIAKDSIDVLWCISEILRNTVSDLVQRHKFEEVFLQIDVVTRFVADSDKEKIFDAFRFMISAMKFLNYDPHLLQPSDNDGLLPLPLRIREKVLDIGPLLMQYFDPFRHHLDVDQPETVLESSDFDLAIASMSSNSLPMIAFRLITALRYLQAHRDCTFEFKADKYPLKIVAAELDQPGSAFTEHDWRWLWIWLDPKINRPQGINLGQRMATYLLLWIDLDKSLRAFEQEKELIDFLHGRCEQEPTTSSPNNTDNESRSSIDGEREDPANHESWHPAYEAFEAWANQQLRASSVQKELNKFHADGARLSEITSTVATLIDQAHKGDKAAEASARELFGEAEDIVHRALKRWNHQGRGSFLAYGFSVQERIRWCEELLTSIQDVSKMFSASLAEDRLEASALT